MIVDDKVKTSDDVVVRSWVRCRYCNKFVSIGDILSYNGKHMCKSCLKSFNKNDDIIAGFILDADQDIIEVDN